MQAIHTKNLGFTLIELVIVIAIIGILAATAIPAYNQYTEAASDNACLSEAQGYAKAVAIKMITNQTELPIHNPSACNKIETPSASDTTLEATPSRTGSGITIICNLANNGLCTKQ